MKIQITYRHADIIELIAKDIHNRSDIVEVGGTVITSDFAILQDNKYVTIPHDDVCITYIATVDSIGV